MWRKLLVLAVLLGLLSPVSGGIIFNRKKKTAADQAAELVKALKNDSDERRRAAAAEALKKVDPKVSPAIVLALIDSLLHDPSQNVRFEAAETLSKYRPVTPQVGQALEFAYENDPSPRVRTALRPLLGQYIAAGYRRNTGAMEPRGSEPALASRGSARPVPPQSVRQPTRGVAVRETAEPPLALDSSITREAPAAATESNERLPSAPPRNVAPRLIFEPNVPVKPIAPAPKAPVVTKPPVKSPAKKPEVEGPILNPPG